MSNRISTIFHLAFHVFKLVPWTLIKSSERWRNLLSWLDYTWLHVISVYREALFRLTSHNLHAILRQKEFRRIQVCWQTCDLPLLIIILLHAATYEKGFTLKNLRDSSVNCKLLSIGCSQSPPMHFESRTSGGWGHLFLHILPYPAEDEIFSTLPCCVASQISKTMNCNFLKFWSNSKSNKNETTT